MSGDHSTGGDGKRGGGGLLKVAVLGLLICNVLSIGGLGAFVLLSRAGYDFAGSSRDSSTRAASQNRQAENDQVLSSDVEDNDTLAESEANPMYAGLDLGPVVKLGSFVVNLNDPGRSRYLKIALRAEVSNSNVRAEVRERQPQIRD
ncbi:MAG: flagellar basal body-associated FliL family protein, partial [Myxococcota bacterium]